MARTLSNSALAELAQHVGYEASQLGGAATLIERGHFPTSGGTDVERIVGNALLESALLHLRSLNDFFGRTASSHMEDVFAVDFLPSWDPRWVLTVDEKKTLDQRLAHLTTARRGRPLRWESRRMRDMGRVFGAFAAELRDGWPVRFAWFKVHVSEAEYPIVTRGSTIAS